MRIRSAVVALVIGVSAIPAPAQTLLDSVFKRIMAKPGAKAAGTTALGAPAVLAAITPAQTASIDTLLAAPLQDTKISADRREAAPLIRAILTTAACAQNSSAWNALNRQHMSPTTFDAGQSYAAMGNMKYHDKSLCLDIARLADWSKPANNALNFKAYLLSPQSGEAVGQRFELQKSTEGQWMIRQLNWAL